MSWERDCCQKGWFCDRSGQSIQASWMEMIPDRYSGGVRYGSRNRLEDSESWTLNESPSQTSTALPLNIRKSSAFAELNVASKIDSRVSVLAEVFIVLLLYVESFENCQSI